MRRVKNKKDIIFLLLIMEILIHLKWVNVKTIIGKIKKKKENDMTANIA